MIGHDQKVEAVKRKLMSLGAKVRVNRRKLAHREKTYLKIVCAGNHRAYTTIVVPAIHEIFPDAYMTSGGFSGGGHLNADARMNLTIALER